MDKTGCLVLDFFRLVISIKMKNKINFFRKEKKRKMAIVRLDIKQLKDLFVNVCNYSIDGRVFYRVFECDSNSYFFRECDRKQMESTLLKDFFKFKAQFTPIDKLSSSEKREFTHDYLIKEELTRMELETGSPCVCETIVYIATEETIGHFGKISIGHQTLDNPFYTQYLPRSAFDEAYLYRTA